jgi:DNA-binding transcriptional LysR family regulator
MSNQLEYRHYKYFLALAKELHYRKAAESLYISQPGLSRKIKQMEDELGIILFDRHSRRVVLTEAGKFLKEELSKHFNHLDQIIDHASHIHNGHEGKIKMAYVGSAMQSVIPPILSSYQKEHPKISFSLNEMDNQQQIEAIMQAKIDVGFVRVDRVPRGLKIAPIFEESFSLVLPENHSINSENFESIMQFKDEHFILFDASYSEFYHENIMQIFDQRGFTPIVSHKTVNASSIFNLVENNLGISIVPTSLKNGYKMKIKFIELKNIPQKATLNLIWKPDNPNPLMEQFLNEFKIKPS